MKRVAICDTNNFINFPIGGQVSSIKNFLKYCNIKNNNLDNFILIGISTCSNQKLGEIYKIEVEKGILIDFLPVAYINSNENELKQSLRKLYLLGLLKYQKKIKDIGIDLFYIQSIESVIPFFLICPKAKRIYFSHGNSLKIIDHLKFGNNNKIFKKIVSLFFITSLKFSDYIFVLDDETFNQYSRYKSIKKIKRVNNSINHGNYEAVNYNKNLNIINLLFVGRLSRNKGIDNIIKSLMYLEDNYYLNIVGVGEEYNYLSNLTNDLNLQDRVKFLGKKINNELSQIYGKSHILMMNSKTEGTPMVILESLANGLPVITTPVGNIPNIIKPGVNGEYVDYDSKNISKKVKKICEKYNNYQKHAYKSSLEFSYDKVNEGIYTFLFSGENYEKNIKKN